ncbi:hypothetical protein Tco_1149398 [Tanacetum coccineum]
MGFVTSPFCYVEGDKAIIPDIDFTCMSHYKLFEYIRAAGQFYLVCLYYCVPDSDLSSGIRELKNDELLGDFVKLGLANEGKIDLYVEHHGHEIKHWIDVGIDENESCHTSTQAETQGVTEN